MDIKDMGPAVKLKQRLGLNIYFTDEYMLSTYYRALKETPDNDCLALSNAFIMLLMTNCLEHGAPITINKDEKNLVDLKLKIIELEIARRK